MLAQSIRRCTSPARVAASAVRSVPEATRQAVVVILAIVVPGVPKVAIHSNGTGDLPGTKLCDLQGLEDYETGLNLSNEDPPNEFYALDCADNTLVASATYWVVFSEDSSPAQTYWIGDVVPGNNSANEDPHGASGWSIGDNLYDQVGAEAWNQRTGTSVSPLAIGVYGTPK